MYACVYVSVETYEQQYWQTVGTLPLLNQINEIHTNELNSIKISSPHITFPELHNEVFPKWLRYVTSVHLATVHEYSIFV